MLKVQKQKLPKKYNVIQKFNGERVVGLLENRKDLHIYGFKVIKGNENRMVIQRLKYKHLSKH